MNRNGSGSKKKAQEIHVWTYDEAKKAVPYISSIMRSLRDERLEVQSLQRQVDLLEKKPGRPGRSALLAQAEVKRQAGEAEGRFDDSLRELFGLDIFCIDPITGQAMIPFLRAEKLAWFVFDLFDEEDYLKQWRYHDDAMEKRRPIAEALAEPPVTV